MKLSSSLCLVPPLPLRSAVRNSWLPTLLLGLLGGIACHQPPGGALYAQVAQPPPEVDNQPPDPAGDPAVDPAVVRRALRQLDADDLQTRDRAERQLLEMGPAVLPLLPQITPRTSGELKVRLQRIRQAQQWKKVTAYFDASTVTLEGKLPLAEALQQITAQTGNAIQLQNAQTLPDLRVELQADRQPFWATMETLMAQAKLRINNYGTTDNALVLSPASSDSSHRTAAFTHGPFRLDLVSVQSNLAFSGALNGGLTVSFQVTWEPRLQPVFMQLPMASIQAETNSGQSLKASNPQAAPEIPLNLGGCTTQVDLLLERPPRSDSHIRSLQGDFTIAVPSDRHQYAFGKLGDGGRQTEKFGDVQVTLEGVRRNGAVYEMRVLVEFGDSQGALDSFRGWILSNEAYLLDAQQTRLENVGLQTYAVMPNAVGIAYLFQINGDPNDCQLIYESPAAITRQTVAYKLQDIELP
ncbi:MAG: hypothetical protein KDA45_07170 [Planctomycetales bacterium]|nr:hypothetical protein [Planctomycetales bacterium]